MTEPCRGSPEYYDHDYFEVEGIRSGYHDFDKTRPFYHQMAEMIQIAFGLSGKKTLDVGCAKGISVSEYLGRGAEAYGNDISFYLEQACPSDVRDRVWQGDLGRPFEEWMARKPADAPDQFDLVTCVETIEHVMPWRVPLAVTNLARVTKVWLYLTIPCGPAWDKNQEHVCIRPEGWWRDKFSRLGGALRRSEAMEEWVRRIVLSDGMKMFETWPWLPFIYEKAGPVPDDVIEAALSEYNQGESLYYEGKAQYDGCEVAK